MASPKPWRPGDCKIYKHIGIACNGLGRRGNNSSIFKMLANELLCVIGDVERQERIFNQRKYVNVNEITSMKPKPFMISFRLVPSRKVVGRQHWLAELQDGATGLSLAAITCPSGDSAKEL